MEHYFELFFAGSAVDLAIVFVPICFDRPSCTRTHNRAYNYVRVPEMNGPREVETSARACAGPALSSGEA